MMATDFGAIRRMNSSSCGLIIEDSPRYVVSQDFARSLYLRDCRVRKRAKQTGQTGFSGYAQRQNRGAVATGSGNVSLKRTKPTMPVEGSSFLDQTDSPDTLNVRTEEW